VDLALRENVNEALVGHGLNHNAVLAKEVRISFRLSLFNFCPKTGLQAEWLTCYLGRLDDDFLGFSERLDIVDHAASLDVRRTRQVIVTWQQGFETKPRVIVTSFVVDHRVRLVVVVNHARGDRVFIEGRAVEVLFVFLADAKCC
jgi:hypothetical protein